MLNLSTDSTERLLQLVEAIARKLELLPPLPVEPPEPPVGTVTKSIGTTGRDYSTITTWEADWDNAGIYSAGDAAQGECYDDSPFDESVTMDGGGTIGLASVTLTVAVGERHDGTAGTGARIVRSASGADILAIGSAFGGIVRRIEWLEVTTDAFDRDITTYVRAYDNSEKLQLSHLLVHTTGHFHSSGPTLIELFGDNSSYNWVDNCVCYGAKNTYTSAPVFYGIYLSGGVAAAYNNTVHGLHTESSSANIHAFGFSDSSNFTLRNNIATDVTSSGSGSTNAFQQTSPSNATVDHNASSDETASGTGSLHGTDGIDSGEFVSTSPVNLHLASDALCIDAGTDLGTTPAGVNIDIDGRDRDAEGDVWDIGADEYVSIGGGLSIPIAVHHYKQLMGAN